MALLGYARVTASHQKLMIQIERLIKAGVRKDYIFTDIMIETTDGCEGLRSLLKLAEKDDVILCTKMDRLCLNIVDMIKFIDICHNKGIAFRFLENGLSTEGVMGQWVVQTLAAIADAERGWMLEQTNRGREMAMVAGVRFGRKPHKETPMAKALIQQGEPYDVVVAKTGISRATYYRLKKQEK